MTTKLDLTDEEREALLQEEPTTIDELLAALDVDNSIVNPARIAAYAPTISFDESGIKAPNYHGMPEERFCNVHVASFCASAGIQMTEHPGAYFRWTNDTAEIDRARDRTIRPSLNHRKEPAEELPGLSVSAGPWRPYFRLTRYCYHVSGDVIRRGPDAESLIEISSLNVLSPLYSRRETLDAFYDRNRNVLTALRARHGVSELKLLGLIFGTCS